VGHLDSFLRGYEYILYLSLVFCKICGTSPAVFLDSFSDNTSGCSLWPFAGKVSVRADDDVVVHLAIFAGSDKNPPDSEKILSIL
jgi:hypothetical protein